MDDDIAEIAARLDRDREEAAEAMTFEQRAIAGVSLFDLMAASFRSGIRLRNPDVSDEEVERLLVEHLREARDDETSNDSRT